jgi:hypothetical protein
MADYVTAEGIDIPSVQELLDDMGADQRGTIDPLLATDPDSVVGSHNGIFASQNRELWEVVQIAFWAMDYRKAEGALLDAILALRGSAREGETPSTFRGSRRLLVTLAAGQSVVADVNLFGIPGTDIEFIAKSSHANPGPGTLDYLVTAECTVDGPISAPAGTVTAVITPGPAAVTNPFDAVLGSDIEKDRPFRERSDGELARAGAGTRRAVTADLKAIQNEDGSFPVRSVEIIENRTSTNGVNGLPPHSWQAIVWDGPGGDADNAAIFEVLNANKVPGIGNGFLRPGQIATTINLELLITEEYAGDTAVKDAIIAYFDTVRPSVSTTTGIVSFSKVFDAIDDVAGIEQIDEIQMQLTGGPLTTNGNVRPGIREVAVVQAADITISTTIYVPPV